MDSLDLEDVSIPVTIGVAIIVGEPLISESSESAEPEALTSGKMNPANAIVSIRSHKRITVYVAWPSLRTKGGLYLRAFSCTAAPLAGSVMVRSYTQSAN